MTSITPIIGTRLRLIALSPRMYAFKWIMPPYREYDTYDPSVEGIVVGIRVFGGEAIEVVVENERRKSNKVAFAHITLSEEQSGAGQEDTPSIGEHGHWIFDQMPDDP